MFKHNICGSQLEVLDGMPGSSNSLPPEFFVNPKCPPVPIVTEAATTEVDLIKPAKDPEENAFVRDQSRLCSPYLFFSFFFFNFFKGVVWPPRHTYFCSHQCSLAYFNEIRFLVFSCNESLLFLILSSSIG